MIAQITDHIERAKKQLLTQYKEKLGIGYLIESFVDQIQQLENVFVTLSVERAVDVAVGVQLDRIGVIVGIERVPGQSDTDYRLAIKIRIGQNLSEGEPESVIQTFRTLTGAVLVILNDGYHAEIDLACELDFTQDQVNQYIYEIKKVVAAGVRVSGLISFDDVEPFAFAGTMIGAGFGSDTNPTAGGKFAYIQRQNDKKFAFDGTNPQNSGFGTVFDPIVGGVFVSV